jgi:hypothetical protein
MTYKLGFLNFGLFARPSSLVGERLGNASPRPREWEDEWAERWSEHTVESED